MRKLIKNELTKIFKKKNIYITLFVILAFVILTNCIYKFFYHSGIYHEYSDSYLQYAKEEIAKLDPNKPSDTQMYIDLKSNLEVYDLRQKYDEEAWQNKVLSKQVSGYINEKNTYLYGENKDSQKAAKIEEEIKQILEKLDQGDWKFFAKEELEQAKTALENLEKQKENTVDKQELQNLEITIKSARVDQEVAEIRLNKDIPYGNDYRNNALESYQSEAKNVINMEANTRRARL